MRSKSFVELRKTNSIFDAPLGNTADAIRQSVRDKTKDIPLEQDAEFLQVIKQQLLGLKKRLRHETLQKLQLLKQIKEFRTNEEFLKGKVARLDHLEKGAANKADAEVQTESDISDSNIRSFPDLNEKLVPDSTKLKARQLITPSPSDLFVAPAAAAANVDKESNEQLSQRGSQKDSKPQASALVQHTVTRANTQDAETFAKILKDEEPQKSPIIKSPSSKRLSTSMFKQHMQKSVNFKTDQTERKEERTTSDGRTLTRTEYKNPNVKSMLDQSNMQKEFGLERQVPPLQMQRFQVNYKTSERVKQMVNSRVSMHATPTGSDQILRSHNAGDSLLRQVNLNFNAGPQTMRQTQTSPLDSLRQNFTINVNEGLSLDEYTYAWRQCDYWMQKAEQMRNDQAQWKNSRNQAWKENAQLQNLIKKKQEKIQELEKVIQDFNLLHPNEQLLGLQTEETKSKSRPLSKTQSAQNVLGFPVPQIQQSLRISIPENTKYTYVPPLAPLTAKHAPLPELLDEEENTSFHDSKDNDDNSLCNSGRQYHSQRNNQTNTYCMPKDKFAFNEDQNLDRNNFLNPLAQSGDHLAKAYTYDQAQFNRARNRKLSKYNRMGVRFNDEEDGNGGEQHQLTGSQSHERPTEREDFVFETPKRHGMLFQNAANGDQPRPDITSKEVLNQYELKDLSAKDRLQKRTVSQQEPDTLSQNSQQRVQKKRSVFSNILRSIF